MIKETLNPDSSKILFVGSKIDLLGIDLDPKSPDFPQEELQKFQNNFQKFKDEESDLGYGNWVDLTYVSSLNSNNVQKVVERLLKHFSI